MCLSLQINIQLALRPDTWVFIIEQSFLFLVVVARWLLPSGELSRNALSQLLFVFIGMASDNTELFGMFDEPAIRCDLKITIATLIIWTASLLPFSLALTAKLSSKNVKATNNNNRNKRKDSDPDVSLDLVLGTDIWSLFIALVLHEVPYLGVRLYTIIENYDILNSKNTIIFFMLKNVLMSLLLCYRVIILCVGWRRRSRDKHMAPASMTPLHPTSGTTEPIPSFGHAQRMPNYTTDEHDFNRYMPEDAPRGQFRGGYPHRGDRGRSGGGHTMYDPRLHRYN
jgi:hypothetical protein